MRHVGTDPSSYTGEMGGMIPEYVPISKEKKNEFATLLKAFSDVQDPHAGTVPIDFFRKNYDTYGPAVMLSVLNDIPFCHAQAHNLGRVIYEHTKDLPAATALCQSTCTAGCVHGVLMGLFASTSGWSDKERSVDDHATMKDLTQEFRKEVAGMCERSEITRYTGIGNCYHAVGHALTTLADYDIPSALDMCTLFSAKGPGAVYYCATGVYMERDIGLGASDAKKSEVYPCTDNSYPAACFRYKLRRVFKLPRDYEKVIQLCAGLSGAQKSGCFH